jgi:alpha-L-fucosidase
MQKDKFMKKSLWSLCCLLALVFSLNAAEAKRTVAANPAHAKKLAWWQEARFGMFIHWGPVSLTGTEIGWARGQQIPIAEYDNLYKKFNPVNFNADTWASVAKAAGMKYVVLTTKHHDGFCLWDTKQTDYNIMNSPFGRDVVKELAAACKKQDLAFGTYYSTCDWHHPDFPRTSPGGKVRRETSNLDRYEQYLRAQVKELLENYGPLSVLWFDVPQEFDTKRGQGVIDFVRSIQPDIIVNNRTGAPGDYDTPEQRVGKYQDNRLWETCMTICNQWAWKPNDTMKSLQQCLQNLVLCAGGDGNLLFNVGPTADGVIEQRQIDRLKEMGSWLEKYGQTIYGTRGGPWKPNKTVASTRKGNVVYLHILRWNNEDITLPKLPNKIVNASLLTGGKVLVKETEKELIVSVAKNDRQEIDTIVKLELDGPAMNIPAIGLNPELKVKATASNVYKKSDTYSAEMAFDEDAHTRWATDAGTKQAWISAEFAKATAFSAVRIEEALTNRVQKFEFQVKEGADWKTLFSGNTIGPKFSKKFPTVNAQAFRLNILEAIDGPTISEIQVQ